MAPLTPIPTIAYDTVITVATPSVDLSNITTCVPVEQVVYMLPNLALKADAIKLGVSCFIAGILLMALFNYIDKKWVKNGR